MVFYNLWYLRDVFQKKRENVGIFTKSGNHRGWTMFTFGGVNNAKLLMLTEHQQFCILYSSLFIMAILGKTDQHWCRRNVAIQIHNNGREKFSPQMIKLVAIKISAPLQLLIAPLGCSCLPRLWWVVGHRVCLLYCIVVAIAICKLYARNKIHQWWLEYKFIIAGNK